jgi:hypothetical protein
VHRPARPTPASWLVKRNIATVVWQICKRAASQDKPRTAKAGAWLTPAQDEEETCALGSSRPGGNRQAGRLAVPRSFAIVVRFGSVI